MQVRKLLALTARRTRLALLALACAVPSAMASAQTIAVNVGNTATQSAAPGSKIVVPIILNLSGAGGAVAIASIQSGLTWNPARLTLDSLKGVSGSTWTFSSDLGGAAGGSATMSASRSTNLSSTATFANAYFSVNGSSGGTHVIVAPTTASNAAAQSVLAALRPRALDVCVAGVGRWGDVTNDGLVNITDAQQIARASVGLSVVDPVATANRGDVTSDGSVNIGDAQQIARYSVGLSAAPLINVALATVPPATAIAVAPGGFLAVSAGTSRQLAATPTAGATDLTGCAPTSWSTSAPGVAVVNSAGYVTAVGAGTAAITVASGGASTVVTVNVTQPVAPTKLGISTQPSSSAPAGSVLGQQPRIQLLSSTNAPVSQAGVAVTAAIASGGGTLGGSSTAITDGNGLATFSSLSITGTTGNRTLSFSSSGLTGVTSSFVSIVPGLATQLTITTQPSASAASGVAFAQQPVIQLRDLLGNSVSQAGVVITAAIASGAGTLGGTTTATTNGSGVASFTNLQITGAAGSRTLTFTGAGLIPPTSSIISISAGPPSRLGITTAPPSTPVSGANFTPQPVIQLLDAAGSATSQSGVVVTAARASGSGTLAGTLTRTTNSSGVATFTDLRINGVGSHTISFNAPGLTSVTTGSLNVLAAATALSITMQPSATATGGSAFAQQPVVQIRNATGGAVNLPGVVVTAAIATGGGALGGTASATTNASGVATFTNLSISGTAGTYTLTFGSPGLTAATSSAINVTVAASTIVFADGFETGNFSFKQNNVLWINMASVSVGSAIARTGTRAVVFNQSGGWAELRFGGLPNLPEVYMQWYMYMPNGTESPSLGPKVYPLGGQNDKFFRLWGTSDSDYGLGTTGETNKVGASTYGSGNQQGVVAIESSLSPTSVPTAQWAIGRAITTSAVSEEKVLINDANRGRWVKIGIHCKVASSANNDGVVEIFVDGVRLTGYTNLKIYPFAPTGRRGFTHGYVLGWLNNGGAPNQKVYVDDFSISTGGFPPG